MTVDEGTGLSCFWFALEDNNTMSKMAIGDIRKLTVEEITSKIMKYRKEKRCEVIKLLKNMETPVLGGCGGTPKELLSEYISTFS